VIDAALGDGVITGAEQHDMFDVTRLLGLDLEVLEQLRAEAQAACAVAVQLAASVDQSSAHDLVGKSICFTGALSGRIKGERITRTMAESLVSAAGLVVRDSVTKGLDILVMADPDSQSTKARRAREYGTRVVGERDLWRSLGVAVA
jgi:DNA polymerase-3 subunit epsilon